MRYRDILREAEDYEFHNLLAAANHQIDSYEQQLRYAERKDQLMGGDVENTTRALRAIRSFFDAYREDSPDARKNIDYWLAQLPKYDEVLSNLPDASKPASITSKALGVWLTDLMYQMNTRRSMHSPDDKARESMINGQLRRAYALGRTGHALQGLFAGLKARSLIKRRDREMDRESSQFRRDNVARYQQELQAKRQRPPSTPISVPIETKPEWDT